jgi:ribosomal-protein-alanine N-acetyltransferase
MRYRPYRPSDFEALYAIERRCFQPPLRFKRTYLRQLTRARNGVTWVAERDTGTTGFAIVEWARQRDRTVAYLPTIEVLPEQRRQGVGGALLRKAEESAQIEGAEAIWMHVDARNEAAQRLYASYGYVAVGAAEDFYGPGRRADILMKLLPQVSR